MRRHRRLSLSWGTLVCCRPPSHPPPQSGYHHHCSPAAASKIEFISFSILRDSVSESGFANPMYLKEFATSLASPRIRPSRHKYARVEVILKATLAILKAAWDCNVEMFRFLLQSKNRGIVMWRCFDFCRSPKTVGL